MIKLSKAIHWLYYLFVFLVVGKQFPIDIEEIIFNRAIQLVGALLFVALMRYNKLHGFISKDLSSKILMGTFLAFVGSFLSGVHKGAILNFLVIFNVMGFLGFGIYTAYFFHRKTFFKRIFYFMVGYFLLMMALNVSIKNWLDGSYNHISVMALFLVSMLYLEKNRVNANAPLGLVPVLITVFFCFFSTGRSAILSSLLMTALIYLRDYISGKRLLQAVLVIGGVMYLVNAYLLDLIFAYSIKFQEQGFTEQGRYIVFELFLKKITEWDSLLFGVNYNRLYEEQSLTIHNSFLSMHSRFGFAIVIFFMVLWRVIKNSFKNYRLGLIILLPILLRSFTDTILISDGFLMGSLFFAVTFIVIRQSGPNALVYEKAIK